MSNLTVIRLFGPYGSGKGTQAKRLSRHYNAPVFDTGAVLRENVKAGTSVGLKAKEKISKGELVTNNIVLELIKNWIEGVIAKGINTIILDGTSRQLDQAELIDGLLKDFETKSVTNVLINISREESILRQTRRRICNNCGEIFPYAYKDDKCNKCDNGRLETREENDPVIAEKRANVFDKETLPVISFYKGKNMLLEIDGTMSMEKVTSEIISKL